MEMLLGLSCNETDSGECDEHFKFITIHSASEIDIGASFHKPATDYIYNHAFSLRLRPDLCQWRSRLLVGSQARQSHCHDWIAKLLRLFSYVDTWSN